MYNAIVVYYNIYIFIYMHVTSITNIGLSDIYI